MRLLLLRAAFLILILIGWEIVGRPLNPLLYVVPSSLPGALVQLLRDSSSPPLFRHLWITGRTILFAYGLAVTVGLALGFLFGFWQSFSRIYLPLLVALYAVPFVVWYPSLMLLFGLGPLSKIAFGFLVGCLPIALAILAGIQQVDRHLITVAASMGANRFAIYWKVILPASAGTLASGLRTGLALTVVGVIAGEILGSKSGVGYVLNYTYDLLKTQQFVALVLMIAAMALAIDGATGVMEARIRRWVE